MSLAESVERARELLRRNGRVSLRLLRREFDLDDEALDLLVEELTDAQEVAVRRGDVLVWLGARPVAARAEAPATPTPQDAERRQLTVLFCDLVDSTRMAADMDAEDWRDLARRYQEIAAAVVERFEGYVAQLLGDGLLAYFGWPAAHEDDAERAVRAGLGILHGLAELTETLEPELGVQLVARVGIHTGPVVVGSMRGGARSETLALGETTNVAARIQKEAEPGTLLISGATLALVRGIFVTAEAERRSLKGITEPLALHRVIQPAGVRSRLAMPGAQLSRFVGREQELGLLLDRWEQAAEGRGQTVLLSGDAGLGKSRLALVLRERLGDQPHTWLECRSTPYTTGTAFFPVIELVEQGLAFAAGDSAEARLRKIENGLALAPLDPQAMVPLVAELLGVPLSDAYPRLELSPELERERTFEALGTWALALAKIQPVLLLVEDLHWCDPSSLELFGRLVQQLPASRVLLLLTTRPDIELPWAVSKSVTPLALTRLGRRSSRELVLALASETLPDAAVTQILERADGVPLYLEELARTALESGALGAPVAIPATLQDSLMARLDRLSAAKEVAQLASVLGREFPYQLLARVVELDESALRQTLARLVEAGLLFQRGTLPDATFTFRHALIQEAAYGSLLRRRRQEIHERTARALEECFAERVVAEPEVVARHYRSAGRPEPAARYFERAAARAVRASAHAEAVGHLREAAELLGQCAETQERAARELAVQTALGASLAQARGFSSEETQAAWQRAHDLLKTVPDSDRLAETLFGIANFEHTRGRLRTAAVVAERLGRLEGGGRLFRPVSQYLLGVTDYYLGRPRSAADHLERAASALEGAAEELSERFGADLCIGTQAFLGWALWMLGEVDRAVVVADASIARARTSRELPSLAFALAFAATLHKMRRDRERALALAREAAVLAERHGYPIWLAVARLVGGWCAIGEESALAQIGAGMASAGNTGNQGAVPHILSILAEAQRGAGLRDQALATLDGALGLSARFEMAFWDAELHRLKGELLLETPGGDPAAAEGELNLALEVARRQEARPFELRAATSLARLWRDRGKTADACAVLQPIYARFTEGFGTLDLIEAKALLDELR